MGIGVVLLVGGCSGDGTARSDDGAGQSGQSDAGACDNSTLPLPANCSGAYTCYIDDPYVGNVNGWLVREGNKCLWQFANYHGQDLSDPGVVIDGRNFTYRESDGSVTECYPTGD